MTVPSIPPNYGPYAVPMAPMRAPKTSRTGPRVMLGFGIVLLAIAVACLVFMATSMGKMADAHSVMDLKDTEGHSAQGSADDPVSVELKANTSYGLFWVTNFDPEPTDYPQDFTVVNAEGGEIPVSIVGLFPANSNDEVLWSQVAQFTVPSDGVYQVSLIPSESAEDPTFGVGPSLDHEDFWWGAFGSVGAGIAAVIAGLPGLGLTIGGAVWLGSRRKAYRAVFGR